MIKQFISIQVKSLILLSRDMIALISSIEIRAQMRAFHIWDRRLSATAAKSRLILTASIIAATGLITISRSRSSPLLQRLTWTDDFSPLMWWHIGILIIFDNLLNMCNGKLLLRLARLKNFDSRLSISIKSFFSSTTICTIIFMGRHAQTELMVRLLLFCAQIWYSRR